MHALLLGHRLLRAVFLAMRMVMKHGRCMGVVEVLSARKRLWLRWLDSLTHPGVIKHLHKDVPPLPQIRRNIIKHKVLAVRMERPEASAIAALPITAGAIIMARRTRPKARGVQRSLPLPQLLRCEVQPLHALAGRQDRVGEQHEGCQPCSQQQAEGDRRPSLAIAAVRHAVLATRLLAAFLLPLRCSLAWRWWLCRRQRDVLWPVRVDARSRDLHPGTDRGFNF